MEYKSPLGYNFNFKKIQESVKEPTETPKKIVENTVSRSSEGDKKFNHYNRVSNPSWLDKGTHSQDSSPTYYKNKKQKGNAVRDRVPTEMYYKPSMVENPWEELEMKMGC